MSRALERRLRKLEGQSAGADDLSQLSDEALAALSAHLLARLAERLACGDGEEQRLGRALTGRTLRDLPTSTRAELLERLQRNLADPDKV